MLFYPIIIGVGTIFDVKTHGIQSIQNGERLLNTLILLSCLLGCFWIYRSKGIRWLVASLVLLQEILLLGAIFVAGMAVTGDWL